MVSLARTAVAAAFSLGLLTGAASATTITTGAATDFLSGYGVGESSGFAGQIFRAPDATQVILQQFQMTLGAYPGMVPPQPSPPAANGTFVVGQIYQWEAPTVDQPSGFPGLIVWDSGNVAVDVASLANGGVQVFTFNPNVVLDQDLTYVALLNVLGNDQTNPGGLGFGVVYDPNPPNGFLGTLVYGTDPAPGTDDEGNLVDLGMMWATVDDLDAAFSATFAAREVAVPAPAALGLFAVGLAGLLVVRRRGAA